MDKFFRDSIESTEAKPSEQFWNRAYESIIVREGNMNRRRVLAWRSAAILIGFIMLGLTAYDLYITDKVKNLRKDVATIQRFQANATLSGKDKLHSVSVPAIGNTNSGNMYNQRDVKSTMPSFALYPHTKPHKTSQTGNKSTSGVCRVVYADANQHTTGRQQGENEQKLQQDLTHGSNAYPAAVTGNMPSVSASVNTISAQRSTNQNNTNVLTTVNGRFNAFKTLFNPVTATLVPFLNATYPEAIKASESMMPDSALMDEPNPAERAKNYFVDVMLHRFSVSGFYSIDNFLFAMSGYNPVERINASQMEANERKETSFSSGISIGYDLSPRFTVQAGCNYQQYQFLISATPLNVQNDLASFYPFESSSGNVNLALLPGWSNPNGGAAAAQGDAIRSYISVPVQLKWNFVEDKKVKIYLTAGGAVNILDMNRADIEWGNSFGSKTLNIDGMEGTNNITYAYLAGIGAEYKLSRGFSAYVEGTYLGALTPVAGDSYINVKPNLLSETIGIKYHL